MTQMTSQKMVTSQTLTLTQVQKIVMTRCPQITQMEGRVISLLINVNPRVLKSWLHRKTPSPQLGKLNLRFLKSNQNHASLNLILSSSPTLTTWQIGSVNLQLN